MLDLGKFKEFEVRLPDGTIVAIKPPSDYLLYEITRIAQVNMEDLSTVASWLSGLSLNILNHNSNNIQFNEYYVRNELNMDMMLALLDGYAQFIAKQRQI